MAIPIKAVLSVSSKGFNVGIKGATKVLGGLVAISKAAAFAVIGVTGAFTALIARQSQVIDRIGKVAKTTGIAAETLQKFSFAAELAGVSTDQAQVALRRFSRRLGEAQKGTGELAPELKRLGINLKDSNGEFKSAEQVLFDLADAIADTEGSSARLSIAFKAFDSEGAELVSVLANGSDAMKALFDEAESLGAVLSGGAIRGVEAFNDEFSKLQTLVSGIANTFVAALAPALTSVTEDIVELLKETAETNGGFENLGVFLKNEFLDIIAAVVGVFGNLGNVIIGIVNKLEELVNIIPGVNSLGFDSLTVEGKALFEQLKKIGGELQFSNRFDAADPFERAIAGIEEYLEANEILGIDIASLRKEFERLDKVGWLKKIGNRQYEKDSAALHDELSNIRDTLLEMLFMGEGKLLTPFDVSELVEYIQSLKTIPAAIDPANEKVEEQLTLFQKIMKLLEEAPAKMNAFRESAVDFGKVFADVAKRLGTPLERLEKTLGDGLVKGVQMFEDTLADAIISGKADFDDLGRHIQQVLAKALVQKFITGPILAAFGLASGGPAKQGQPYIVGEEGPELFVPNHSGTVIPNHALNNAHRGGGMGGGQQVTYNINAVDTQSFQQALARDPEFLFSVTQRGARSLPSRG